MDELTVMRKPFDINTHKKHFINYLEVIITEDGKIEYATPSHTEKVIQIACDKLKISREELYDKVPQEYYGDMLAWLNSITGCVEVWTTMLIGKPNEQQLKTLQTLKEEGLYTGHISFNQLK